MRSQAGRASEESQGDSAGATELQLGHSQGCVGRARALRRRPEAGFRADPVGEGADTGIELVDGQPEQGGSVEEAVVVGDDAAVVDGREDVGDGEHDPIGSTAEDGTEVDDPPVALGIPGVEVGFGELVGGHFAVFVDESGRVADAIGIPEQGFEVVVGDGTVFAMREHRLLEHVVAEAVDGDTGEFVGGHATEVGDGVGGGGVHGM